MTVYISDSSLLVDSRPEPGPMIGGRLRLLYIKTHEINSCNCSAVMIAPNNVLSVLDFGICNMNGPTQMMLACRWFMSYMPCFDAKKNCCKTVYSFDQSFKLITKKYPGVGPSTMSGHAVFCFQLLKAVDSRCHYQVTLLHTFYFGRRKGYHSACDNAGFIIFARNY